MPSTGSRVQYGRFRRPAFDASDFRHRVEGRVVHTVQAWHAVVVDAIKQCFTLSLHVLPPIVGWLLS